MHVSESVSVMHDFFDPCITQTTHAWKNVVSHEFFEAYMFQLSHAKWVAGMHVSPQECMCSKSCQEILEPSKPQKGTILRAGKRAIKS